MQIRLLEEQDLPWVKGIIDASELFPSELLEEMVSPFFTKQTTEFWLVASDTNQKIIGLAYCAPERMTDGTWNILLVAVSSERKRSGVGYQLVQNIEKKLAAIGARVLLVETSGKEEFESVRQFYQDKCQFKQIAMIPEYYEPGDDKIVFYKKISSAD